MRPAAPRTGRQLRRRRLVAAGLGAFLTCAGVWVVHGAQGLFWTDTKVYFLLPAHHDQKTNNYASTTQSVIATAGLVGRMVQPTPSRAGVGTDTTLLAQGVRHGSRVQLPNSGGQWESDFEKPVLDVQVVGTTPDEVATRTTQLLAAIQHKLDEAQRGVTPAQRIGLRQQPRQTQLYYSQGDPKRAMGGTLLIGALITTMLIAWSGRRRGSFPLEPATEATLPTVRGSDAAASTTDVRRRVPVGVG